MVGSEINKSLILTVGEQLTKVTIVQELHKAKELLQEFGSELVSRKLVVNFEEVKKVDTLGVVYIVQIERSISNISKDLKVTYVNVPDDLAALLRLTSLAQVISSDN